MSWSDEDDLFENQKPKKMHRKPRKHIDRLVDDPEGADDGAEYRRKRAGKRSHRQKTHKDDFWDGELPRPSIFTGATR
jgi:hypothetical protein